MVANTAAVVEMHLNDARVVVRAESTTNDGGVAYFAYDRTLPVDGAGVDLLLFFAAAGRTSARLTGTLAQVDARQTHRRPHRLGRDWPRRVVRRLTRQTVPQSGEVRAVVGRRLRRPRRHHPVVPHTMALVVIIPPADGALARRERLATLDTLVVGVATGSRHLADSRLLHDGDGDRFLTAYDHHHHRGEARSEEHTSELQSLRHLVCRLVLEK